MIPTQKLTAVPMNSLPAVLRAAVNYFNRSDGSPHWRGGLESAAGLPGGVCGLVHFDRQKLLGLMIKLEDVVHDVQVAARDDCASCWTLSLCASGRQDCQFLWPQTSPNYGATTPFIKFQKRTKPLRLTYFDHFSFSFRLIVKDFDF